MVDTLFLMSGFVPLLIGLGLIFRPKKMMRVQAKFRKRMEKFEKQLYKAHRATGLGFLLLAVIILLNYFHPIWIFNLFLVTRLVAGLFFPQFFLQPTTTYIIPTVWI